MRNRQLAAYWLAGNVVVGGKLATDAIGLTWHWNGWLQPITDTLCNAAKVGVMGIGGYLTWPIVVWLAARSQLVPWRFLPVHMLMDPD